MGNEMSNQNFNGLQAPDQGTGEISKTTDGPSEVLIVSSVVDHLEDDKSNLISSMEIDDFNENTYSGRISKPEIQQEDEKGETETIPSIHPKSNKYEPVVGVCYELDIKSTKGCQINDERIDEIGDELGDGLKDRLIECVMPDIKSRFLDNKQGFPEEGNESCQHMTLMCSDTGEEKIEHLGFVLQGKPIISAYLDAIDIEIKRLLVEDDRKAFDGTPASEDGHDGNQSKACMEHEKEKSDKDSTKIDIEIGSLEIQLKAMNRSQAEEQEIENRLEESMIELVETDEREDLGNDGDENILVADNEHKEKMNCKSEVSNNETKLVENSETNRERIWACSSLLADLIVDSSREMTETEELNTAEPNAETNVVRGFDDDIKLMDSENDGEEFSLSTSYLLDYVDRFSEEMLKEKRMNATGNTTDEKTETFVRDFGDNVEVCNTTVPGEVMQILHVPKCKPSDQNKVLIYNQEFEWKHTSEESEKRKGGFIIESSGDTECLDVCSIMPDLVDGTFPSVFELETDMLCKDETGLSLTQMVLQETEGSKTECSELNLHSAIEFHNNKQERISVCSTATCSPDTQVEALESSGRYTIELDEEKFNSNNGGTKRVTRDLGKLLDGTVAAAGASLKQDSEDYPLPICAFETSEQEKEGKSATNISELEARVDEDTWNPSLYHEQTSKDGAFTFERIVPENNNSKPRYYVTVNQEVFSEVGTETTITELASISEVSDTSPLLHQKSPEATEVSALEKIDSVKLTTPLVSLLKEEAYVFESFEKNEGLVLKKTVEEVWRSPVKGILTTYPKPREKQKPISSLFRNCMCCTTAIN